MFSTPAPIPAWLYIPVLEEIVINPSKTIEAAGSASLQSFVGPFSFKFSGQANFERERQDATVVGVMKFGFDTVQVTAFNGAFSWRRQITPKPKTYSFFFIDDDQLGIACARSSGTGGKNLMHKNVIT